MDKSKNMNCDKDGKYRWQYEVNLFKNPAVFILVWKILFFILLGIFLFVILIDTQRFEFWWESFLINGKVFGIAFAVMTGITILGYLIYAAVMGGKYIVDFEMDEKGILHKQAPSQAKKAKKLGALTAAAGAVSGKPSVTGAGLNATRTELYSEFKNVKKVKSYPRRNLIKLNGLFIKNQIYIQNESFEFVLNYINSRVKIEKNKVERD